METYTTSRPLLDRRDRKDLPDRRGPLDRKVPLDQKGLPVLRVRRARLDPPDLRVILDRRVPKVRRGSRVRRAHRGYRGSRDRQVQKGIREKTENPDLPPIRLLCQRDTRERRRNITIFCILWATSTRSWTRLTVRWSDGDDKR